MTSFTLRSANPAKTRADAVVVGVVPGQGDAGPSLAAGAEEVAAAYGRKLRGLLATLGVTGRTGEVTRIPTGGVISSPLLVLVGLGAGSDVHAVRRAAGAAARAVPNAASVAIALPAESPDRIAAIVEGWRLGGYTFTAYKSGGKAAKKDTTPAEVVVLSPAARRQESASAAADAQLVATAVAEMRDWVNTPPNDLTPPKFADAISAAVKETNKHATGTKIKAKVLDEQELAELGCGGILAVGGGSAAPPRLVELTYAPKGARTHLALVGKGITFDSGGLWIKPAASMATMKEDMAGAAAVVQALLVIAQLGLPLKVSVHAALAENMISGSTTRPGDVITTLSGTTVEMSNTDAEGRVVLADALTRAVATKPDLLVDIATLTGHMVVALGDRIGGVMGDDDLVDQVLAAARTAGEEAWPMPIPDFMDERVRSSKVADLAQYDGIRWGGGLYAAAFLRQFTGGVRWAHLDIAGPTFNKGGPSGHVTTGATGYGLTTLVALARGLSVQ